MFDRAVPLCMSVAALVASYAALTGVISIVTDDHRALLSELRVETGPAEDDQPVFAVHLATSVVRVRASDVPRVYLHGPPAQWRSGEKALLGGEVEFLARAGLNPGIPTTSQRFPTIGDAEIIELAQKGQPGSPDPRVLVVLEY